MRRVLVFLALVKLLAVAGLATVANPDAPKSTPELKQIISAGKKTIVFFLNSQGGPCRAQHEAVFRYVTGGVLVVFDLYSLVHGSVAF